MTSTASLPKPTGGASSARRKRKTPQQQQAPADEGAIGYDLVTQLTYMTNVALASASRDQIFEKTAQLDLKTVGPFNQVYQAVRRLGIEYTAAFQMVARTTRSRVLKSMLLRFSGALGSGDSEATFLGAELRVEMERYEEHYERSLESLRKWTDAYASLLVSVILIIVVAMVSTMISQISQGSILVLGFLMILITGVGAWIIFRVAPQEATMYTGESYMPPVRRLAYAAALFIAVPGLVVALIVAAFKGVPYGLVIGGIATLPAGILIAIDEGRVSKIDSDLPHVLRSLGATTSALGSTISVGLDKMDRRSMGKLEPYMERLNTRLGYRLSPETSWGRFVSETGSESVRRTFRCLIDAINMGAPPDHAAVNASDLALRLYLLRARRTQVANTFAFLVIPLHVSMVGLIMFIFSIVELFNKKIGSVIAEMDAAGGPGASAMPNLPYFQTHDLGLLGFLTTVVVVSLALANGLTPVFALGGHPLKAGLYVGISSVTAGLTMIIIPNIAAGLLPA
ncbi:MAG: hypothetical protein HY681_06695 [Chloroflexi bacterium]|nr:hypothetical protein [Chloroflexota bacterium]